MSSYREDRSFERVNKALGQSGEVSQSFLEVMHRRLDEALDRGEGYVDGKLVAGALKPGLYRWVRVYEEQGKKRKFIATFYLHTVDGELQGMWLARERHGMNPNPLDSVGDAFYPGNVGEVEGEPFGLGEYTFPDEFGSQGVKGMKPVRVEQLSDPDGLHDDRWQLREFKIRSSKLAPMLVKCRDAGMQQVSIKDLQRGMNAQGHKGASPGR